MSNKAKSKKTTKKAITFEQFKAWLSGVEDLQSSDWYPSQEQWKIIREKIDSIKVPEAPSNFNQQHNEKVNSPGIPYPPQQMTPVRAPVVNLPPVNSTISTNDTVNMANQQRHVTRLPPVFDGKPTNNDSAGYHTSSFE